MELLDLSITSLQDRPDLALQLARWYLDDSPEYFSGRTEADIAAEFFAVPENDGLPLVLIALRAGIPCGTISLRESSITVRPELSPWLAGLYVPPASRRRGIGGMLIAAGEAAASSRGIRWIYAGTATADALLTARKWLPVENVEYHGQAITIYRKALSG
jgi:GNAT superfamily N-acetyltransferase